MKGGLKKAGVLLCILVLFSAFMPGTGIKADFGALQNSTEAKTVKVGYYEFENFLEGATPEEYKTGYGYEYLQKIASVCGWKYEYVYGSRIELYEALLRGEIDILPGLGYSAIREKEVSFPDYAMGQVGYYLFIPSENMELFEDASPLNNKNIGALSGVMGDVLNKWLLENGIVANIKQYETMEDERTALKNRDIEAFIGDGVSTTNDGSISPYIKIATENIYLCVSKDNARILEELNIALEEIDTSDPYYIQSLTQKYFKKSIVNLSLSGKEKKWLANNEEIIIGYMKDYLPFSATDENGNVTGIISDIIPEIFSKLEVEEPDIKYKEYNNSYDMLNALKNKEIDAAFPVSDSSWFSEQYGIYHSKAIISSSMNLVYKEMNGNDAGTIAVNKNNIIQMEYLQTYYRNALFYYCDSIEECLDAVNSGKARSTVVSGLRVSGYLAGSKFGSLKTVTLPQMVQRCLGVSNDNHILLGILNRGITCIDEDFATTSAYKYEGRYASYTLRDFLEDNLVTALIIVSIVVSLVISIIAILVFTARSRRILNKMAHLDDMTSLYNRRAYEEDLKKIAEGMLPDNLVFMLMDINGLKASNDLYGHDVGDELIRNAAACLLECLNEYGAVYRIGGDEFAAIIIVDDDKAEEIKRDLKDTLAQRKGQYGEGISAAVGFVKRRDMPNASIFEIAKVADAKMYEEKKEYHNETDKNN
ncbi:MAG: transporter substrate-binding domain-containing protein [Lachnospiraceae bacterium]|nr:transporter substrate-binding domain-containing protein [Lachnospiraceae bacterium]